MSMPLPALASSENAATPAIDRLLIVRLGAMGDVLRTTALLPDILVKGGDWADDEIVGREEVEAAGGKVVRAEIVQGYSTTDILKKIRGL